MLKRLRNTVLDCNSDVYICRCTHNIIIYDMYASIHYVILYDNIYCVLMLDKDK